jgi:glycosyltransferase involved in cell wall biosynthesis
MRSKIHIMIDVIIPAYNEENSIGRVIDEIPTCVRNIIVVNNGSTDDTAVVARQKGAIVIEEGQRGYGKACLTGIAYLNSLDVQPDILVFLDGDYSDYPEELIDLVAPIIEHDFDMVIGSRALGVRESGSMTYPQVFGNWLATLLMRKIYKAHFTDLGPFRAIKWDKLKKIGMIDQNFGWTIEMQIKAVQHHLSYTEVPVNYKKRIGTSKVSGTVKGVLGAGYKILWTIWRYS